MTRLAFFGGVYSNYLAVEAALKTCSNLGVDGVYCLGDMGAFGPHPNRAIELLVQGNVHCIQGNYDNSVGNNLADCQCGYTDPRDNHFARISYEYTLTNTSNQHRDWLQKLPPAIRLDLGSERLLLCHGSPRRTNEFLWESTCSTHFLDGLCREYEANVIATTHTGIHWERHLTGKNRFINVGVLGRPENDGTPRVWCTILEARENNLRVEFLPIEYDHHRLAKEMAAEGLPGEFQETIISGYWTSCLEILPAKERRRGRF